MSTHYYNTNQETGGKLKESNAKALSQKKAILAYFKLHPNEELTPYEVQEGAGLTASPITSTRRAMTDLSNAEYLIKTENQKDGIYKDSKNFCWKLNKDFKEAKKISRKPSNKKKKEKRTPLVFKTTMAGHGKTYTSTQPSLFD